MDPAPPQRNSRAENVPIYTDVNQVPLSLLEQLSGHWRTIVEQKRRQHDVSTKQIIWGQLFTIVAVATLSVLVEKNKESLLLVGSTLILYPSLVDLMVSNSAVLAASVHHDIDLEKHSHAWFILRAVGRSILIATIACSFVGCLAGIMGLLIFGADFIQTLRLSMFAGALTGLLGFPLVMTVTLIARRLRTNPDDVIPPFENTVFNVLVLLMIGVVSRVLT